MKATGLSDKFGKPGHCCQATELWRIRESFRVHYTRSPQYVVMKDGRVFIDGKESILTAPIDKLDN
jgi:hypothetical protein